MKISRSELYELVWSEPKTNLAEKFGVSGVVLTKVCKKHEIPYPAAGYWVKKQHGKEVPKTPLPNRNHNPEIEVVDPKNSEDAEKLYSYQEVFLLIDINGRILQNHIHPEQYRPR